MHKVAPFLETKELTEEEKLYRCFGAATRLREKGKYGEAIEILEYILDKKPGDDYLETYLHGLKYEMMEQNISITEENTSFIKDEPDFIKDNLYQIITSLLLLIPKVGKQYHQLSKEIKDLYWKFSEYSLMFR